MEEGTLGNEIIYRADPGESAPTMLTFTAAANNYYWEIEGWTIASDASDSSVTTCDADGSYIIFDSCTFTGAPRVNPSSGSHYPYYTRNSHVVTGTGDYNQFINCNWTGGNRGIDGKGDYWTVDGCTITGLSEDGIYVNTTGGESWVISDNTIYDMHSRRTEYWWPGTETGTVSDGMAVFQDRDGDGVDDAGEPEGEVRTITGGYIYVFLTADDSALSRSDTYLWRDQAAPTTNYFTPSGGGDNEHTDCLTIAALTVSPTVLTVERNLFHTPNDGQLVKISSSGGSFYPDNVTMQNNIIYGEYNSAYLVICENSTGSTQADNYWYNNIILTTSGAAAGAFRFNDSNVDFHFYNNIISGAVWSAGNSVSHSHNVWGSTAPAQLQGDADSFYSQDLTNSGSPRYFTDYANNDYTHYNSSSNAVDAASATYAPPEDYLEFARPSNSIDDIGAYELDQGGVSEPTVQPTSLQFSNVTHNSMTIGWTTGNGTNEIVVVSASDVIADPADTTTYNPSTVFGSGDTTAAGDFVVYTSTSNSVTVTNLSASTTYYVAIYAFNGSGGSENYLTTGELTGSQATTAAPASTYYIWSK
jgi:hypothetical protein